MYISIGNSVSKIFGTFCITAKTRLAVRNESLNVCFKKSKVEPFFQVRLNVDLPNKVGDMVRSTQYAINIYSLTKEKKKILAGYVQEISHLQFHLRNYYTNALIEQIYFSSLVISI